MKDKPYVIAELSGNHNGDIQRAFSLIEAAKKAGVSAVKLQTYTADTMTIDHNSSDFLIKTGPWKGFNLYELYKKAYTPWEWHEALFDKGKELGITVFSTPFDKSAVDFLEKLDAPLYKIASFEVTDFHLIEYIAKKNKPIILSTGLANFDEINEAVNLIKNCGCKDLTVLHCVSAYPAQVEDFNLSMLPIFKEKFGVNVGISDHTLGSTIAVAATALGATVIEKHLTLSRKEGGVDSSFSAEPDELKHLCEETRKIWKSLHKVNEYSMSEEENKNFRRSIYPVKDIQLGEKFSEDNIRCIRPAYSLHPRYYDQLLGKKAKRFIQKGTRLALDDF